MILGEKSPKNNPVHKKFHLLWRSMTSRCKDSEYITVCERWKNYDYFIEDIDKVDGFDLDLIMKGKLELDKDKKQFFKKYKVYSKETCSFITPSENSSFRYNNKYFLAIHLESEEVYLEHNREKFCRENNLDSSTIWRMLKTNSGVIHEKYSQTKKYKGFMFFYIEDFSMDKLIVEPQFCATNIDTGVKTIFSNRRKFARDFGLPYQSVLFCINGKYKRTGRYTIKQINDLNYKSSTTIESKVNNLLKQVE